MTGTTEQKGAWVENRPSRGWRGLDVREMWAYRELAWFLAVRDLKVRYKQAVFGVGWALVQPLAGVAVFTFVFDRVADVPSDGIPYPLFSFVGLIVWTYTTSTLTRVTDVLVANASLVTKVYFPRLIAPLSGVVPGLVDLSLSLALLFAAAPFIGISLRPRMLLLPLLVLAMIGVVLGIGLWLATLNVQYRDVREATGLFISLWLFISPVAYPASSVEGVWGRVYALNPVVGIIGAFRWSLLGGPWPGIDLLLSLGVATLLLLSGLLLFLRLERRFADVI